MGLVSYTFFEGYRGDDEPMGKMKNEAEIRMIINLSNSGEAQSKSAMVQPEQKEGRKLDEMQHSCSMDHAGIYI